METTPGTNSSPTSQWLALRLRIVFAHYFERAYDKNTLKLIVAEWVRSLGGFEQVDVEEAFEIWVDTESKRPSPADIRKLAQDRQDVRKARAYLAALEPPKPEVQVPMSRDARHAILRKAGFGQFADREDAAAAILASLGDAKRDAPAQDDAAYA